LNKKKDTTIQIKQEKHGVQDLKELPQECKLSAVLSFTKHMYWNGTKHIKTDILMLS